MHHVFPPMIGKLKKWDTVDEVNRSLEIPEAPNRAASQPGKKFSKVGIPLPPPPPPEFNPLMKSWNQRSKSGKDSPDSSFYSPGMCIHYTRYSTIFFPFFFFHSQADRNLAPVSI